MKKKDYDYFQAFTQAVDYSCQAAEILKNTLTYFDTDKLNDRLKDVHGVEHAADLGKHEMMSELARAFITPIEREDILELMQELDDVTDDIEDVLIRTYIFHILSIREDALRFADIISRCCGEMLKMMKEFRDFRKSKTIHEMIVTINDLEEEGDRLYTEAVRRPVYAFQGSHRADGSGGRSLTAWKNVAMPASMWPILWKASS